MTIIVLPALSEAQEQSWLALLEISALMPTGWTLVGGQMVHLHCWERGVRLQRPTDDGDAALDVRGEPLALHKFTSALNVLGFHSAGESFEGHHHRWVRDLAQIDVLIPRGVGDTARKRTGVTGGTTLESAGSQQALHRSEVVQVRIGTTDGTIRRPNLLGALVSKAAAHTNNDPYKTRHVIDFAILLSMATRSDLIADLIAKSDFRYLGNMTAILRAKRELWHTCPAPKKGLPGFRWSCPDRPLMAELAQPLLKTSSLIPDADGRG